MNELVLLPEVDARRALRDHRLRLSLLVPFGHWIGRGTLRVLRVAHGDESTELTVGYESYERVPLPAASEPAA
ncbi:MAG TPA: hypothetical protein VGF18_00850 [Candidatus Tumulicola sp.]